MYRRYRERRYHHRRQNSYARQGNRLAATLRRPSVQIGILAVAAFIIYLILQAGSNNASASLPKEISVADAFTKYQQGAFFLDVRTQDEWNQFHAPNSTLIPLDQLPSRLNEVPKDKEVVVVCRSGNRSQQGRDILLSNGFKQVTSMTGGLTEWRAAGYPVTP